jgi:oligoribonuclease NrnB/cAMP/cGMP phosphodiesterase (DHH superfamily)
LGISYNLTFTQQSYFDRITGDLLARVSIKWFDHFRSAYKGEENEIEDKGDKVTIDDLLSGIQASEEVRRSF